MSSHTLCPCKVRPFHQVMTEDQTILDETDTNLQWMYIPSGKTYKSFKRIHFLTKRKIFGHLNKVIPNPFLFHLFNTMHFVIKITFRIHHMTLWPIVQPVWAKISVFVYFINKERIKKSKKYIYSMAKEVIVGKSIQW